MKFVKILLISKIVMLNSCATNKPTAQEYTSQDYSVEESDFVATTQEFDREKALSEYFPKKGDVFMMETAHNGIVITYDNVNDCIYTVEGNTSGRVLIRKRPIYGLPPNNTDYVGSSYEVTGYGSNGSTSNGIIPSSYTKGSGKNSSEV